MIAVPAVIVVVLVLALTAGGGRAAARAARRRPPRPPTRARTASTPRAPGGTSSTRSGSARARRARRSSPSSPTTSASGSRAGATESVPGHPGLRNVVGRIPGSKPAIVLAAHYDTKDLPGFVGANDGAGGTAAVIEIARALRKAQAAQGRAGDPLRLLRRRGGHGRHAAVRGDRAARLEGLRPAPRQGDPRARAARLRRREGRDADPARGGLGPEGVEAPARGGPARRHRALVPAGRRRARSPTTTRRSRAGGSRRST